MTGRNARRRARRRYQAWRHARAMAQIEAEFNATREWLRTPRTTDPSDHGVN